MERSSPVLFSITTIFLDKASNCYDKYGKYVKWSAFGFLSVVGFQCLLNWYRDDKKVTPPPATSSPPADPPESNPSTATSEASAPVPSPTKPVREPPRRPKILQGLDGPVEFPNVGDCDSITNYVAKHSEMSQNYLIQKNYNLATYHSSLLLFIHPDPMAYFETNSGYMPEDTYEIAKRSLIRVLEMVEDQMKEDDPAPES